MAAAAVPMGDPTVDIETPTIPLECILCPKSPMFSDISHLLTHVSSKSHLHHKFSLELKATSEASAREKLERYGHWYSSNEIARLLSERMAAKDQRKPTRRARTSAAAKPAKSRRSSGALDPANFTLGTISAATSTVAASTTSTTARAASTVSTVSATTGYPTPDLLPTMAPWSTAPSDLPMPFSDSRDSPYLDSSIYHTSMPMRYRPSFFFEEDMTGSGSEVKDHESLISDPGGLASDIDTSLGFDFLDDEFHDNKLKGVVWPGMALFDSATPDQKRKRNQRKDIAAIEQMKQTSQAVLATETVWGPEGDLRKVRDIYASPSIDGSPPTSPLPKQRNQSRQGTPGQAGTGDMPNNGESGNATKKRRVGRPPSSGIASSRQTRAATRGSDKGQKKKPDVAEATGEATFHPSSHARKNSFSVFFEGTANDQSVMDGMHNPLGDAIHENGFAPSQRQRSVLQQLDPNLTMTEATPFFKNSSSSHRFFDGATGSPHLAFRPHASYNNAFHGLGNASMLHSQLGNSVLYPSLSPFDGPLFGGSDGSESGNGSRISFGDFGIDPATTSFGFDENRGSELNDSAFPDQILRSSNNLFEM